MHRHRQEKELAQIDPEDLPTGIKAGIPTALVSKVCGAVILRRVGLVHERKLFHNLRRVGFVVLDLEVFESAEVVADQPTVVVEQVDDQEEEESAQADAQIVEAEKRVPGKDGLCRVGIPVPCHRHCGFNQLESERGDDPEQHSHEQNVVKASDIVAHPLTVVVKLVATPVAEAAVLRILDDETFADGAVELGIF